MINYQKHNSSTKVEINNSTGANIIPYINGEEYYGESIDFDCFDFCICQKEADTKNNQNFFYLLSLLFDKGIPFYQTYLPYSFCYKCCFIVKKPVVVNATIKCNSDHFKVTIADNPLVIIYDETIREYTSLTRYKKFKKIIIINIALLLLVAAIILFLFGFLGGIISLIIPLIVLVPLYSFIFFRFNKLLRDSKTVLIQSYQTGEGSE